MTRVVRAVGATLAAMLLSGFPAHAMDPPSGASLESLRQTSDLSPIMRITTPRVRYEVTHPQFDAQGMRLRIGSGRPALITIGTIPVEEKRISWADIAQIEVGKKRIGRSVLLGTLLGAAAGGALVAMNGPDIAVAGDAGVAIAGAGLALLGFTVGLLHGISSPHYEVLLTQDPSRR